jgi:hypothetical protein
MPNSFNDFFLNMRNGQMNLTELFERKKCKKTHGEMLNKIKATLRFYLTPVRMATIKNTNYSTCWQGCGRKEPSYNTGGNVN